MAFAVGLLAFAAAYAGWRWGLGNRNWLEGVVVASIAGGLAWSVARFTLRLVEAAGRA